MAKLPPKTLTEKLNGMADLLLKDFAGSSMEIKLDIFRETMRLKQILNRTGDDDDDDSRKSGNAFEAYRKEVKVPRGSDGGTANPAIPDPADDPDDNDF
jgi:hypothetical protein